MKRLLSTLWFGIVVLSPIWGQERVPLSAVLPVLETYVDKAMAAEGVPGAVIVVVKDGKIAYLKGFGVKVLGTTEPVDEHTPFALASVTKNFTNTLVARLVDQGKLSWEDKVTKYLPDFHLSDPSITQELTIEDMLSHRSGLPGFSADTLINLGWSAPEVLSSMKKLPNVGEFRKDYDYQNVLVGVVGMILEKVTRKPLPQLFKDEIFQPVGLEETRIGKPPALTLWKRFLNLFKRKQPQPTFHDSSDGKTRYLPNGNPSIYTFPASSGGVSTGKDMGKWLIFQLNNAQINGKPLVREANLNEMRTPHITLADQGNRQFPKNRISQVHYGLGWFIHDYMGVPMLSHMGGMNGTRALILIIPADNLGIAIMTNFGGMRVSLFPEAIRNKFLDLYLNVKEEVDWAKQLRDEMRSYRENHEKQRRLRMLHNLAPARNLDDYVGVYENSLYGRVEISNGGDSLILTYRDSPKLKLNHWNGNVFQFVGYDLSTGFGGIDHGEIVFSNERGKASRMMINLLSEGIDSVFDRVE